MKTSTSTTTTCGTGVSEFCSRVHCWILSWNTYVGTSTNCSTNSDARNLLQGALQDSVLSTTKGCTEKDKSRPLFKRPKFLLKSKSFHPRLTRTIISRFIGTPKHMSLCTRSETDSTKSSAKVQLNSSTKAEFRKSEKKSGQV